MTTDRDRALALIRLLVEIRAEARLLPPDALVEGLLNRAILRVALRGGVSADDLIEAVP